MRKKLRESLYSILGNINRLSKVSQLSDTGVLEVVEGVSSAAFCVARIKEAKTCTIFEQGTTAVSCVNDVCFKKT